MTGHGRFLTCADVAKHLLAKCATEQTSDTLICYICPVEYNISWSGKTEPAETPATVTATVGILDN